MKKGRLKKILLIILLVIVFIVLLFLAYRFISNKLDEANAEKMRNIISEVNKEKISYVFVEINPSFVLTVKDNKVSAVACLNDDCVSVYNDIDVKDKNINESIDNLYNISKQKGFDTSNGVKVKTSDNINIESKDYITVEYIDTTKEKELLNEVKNNEEIKNVSNDDCYSTLWEELKKDPKYDDVYTCNMNDNKELECYIILDTGINEDKDYDVSIENGLLNDIFMNSSNKILNTLKKFNFDVRDTKVYINNIEFGYVPLFTASGTPYKNALTARIVDILDDDVCNVFYDPDDPTSGIIFEGGKCKVEDGFYIIPLNKVNLVNPASSINNMVTFRLRVTENFLNIYEIYENMKMLGE